jgi:Zn-dependent protease
MGYTIALPCHFLNMDNLLGNIIFFIGLIIAITVHEFSHAFTADHFGDPTPRSYGRLSLNPLRHLDPLGTLMLFVVHFGWGKPVPIDPYNLSKKEETLVALAGPGSNIIIALLFSLLFRLLPLNLFFAQLIGQFVIVNISLAVFNLLPLPPLDGSKLFLNLLPEQKSIEWQAVFDQYGIFLLAILLFLPIGGGSMIGLVITPVISFLIHILLGIT